MKILTSRKVDFENNDLFLNGKKIGQHYESSIVRNEHRFYPERAYDKANGGPLSYFSGSMWDTYVELSKVFKCIAMEGDTISYDGTGQDVGWCIMNGRQYYKRSLGKFYLKTAYPHATKWFSRDKARAVAKTLGKDAKVVRYSEAKVEYEREHKITNGVHNLLRAVSMIFYALEQKRTPQFPVAEMKIAFDGLRAAGFSEFDLEHGLQHYGVYHQTYDVTTG